MTVALDRPVCTIDPATLVPDETMQRLTARIVKEHVDINHATARRIVGQAAAFLVASGQRPGADLSPSRPVDIGWHAFILHTVDYALFCQQVIGRFIHHVPTGDDNQDAADSAASRQRTLAAITDAGYAIDHDLWPVAAKAGDCSQCHAGCTDSPNGGKK